ncbi:MAG: macro domain-containing protein [Gemmatimonadota bacterium]|jgi:O-acetyl-ADP-ribose deacetylase (regulator of RNase III)
MAVLVRVEQGDIATFDGDAVVNAANNHLVLGAGVAGAIQRRGGPSIQAECDDYVRSNGPLQVGEAVVTGAGDLPCRWVIHAASMGDVPPSSESIRSSTRHSLRLAMEKGMESVAFPVLGSGIGGFAFHEAGRIMLEEIRAHGEREEKPGIVVLYGYTPEDAAALQRLVTER